MPGVFIVGKSHPEMGGIFESYSRLSIDLLKRASFGILGDL